MQHSNINTAEAISIILTVFVAHSFISLPRTLLISCKSAILINLVYVSVIACFFTFLIFRLLRGFGSSDIIDISEYLGGTLFKKIIGFIFIFYLIFSSSILLRSFAECLKVVFYPMTNILFIILTFIIAITIENKYKFEATAKISLLIL
ncbi:MAG: GerAB/ArcD/ProY family transporter, partial [Clostridia bacterium]|nr:GerAB/ArcD/ProY family transporter [Clostridia bacterium]